MMFKHLPFQCWCNDNEILASYTKGHYDFFDVEQIQEFVVFKGAYEIASFLENIDDGVLLYLNIALKITMLMLILLIILRESLPLKGRDKCFAGSY